MTELVKKFQPRTYKSCQRAILEHGRVKNELRTAFSGRPVKTTPLIIIPDQFCSPVLVTVPHAGRNYPQHVVERARVPVKDLERLEDRYADSIGRDAAANTNSRLIVNPLARAAIDVNRAPNDMNPLAVKGKVLGYRPSDKARGGLGLIPDKLSKVGPIWKRPLTDLEVSDAVTMWHAPYHLEVKRQLELIRRQYGVAVLLDLHSMPPLPKRRAGEKPTHFVLGNHFGRTSSDRFLQCARLALTQGAPQSGVGINTPYAGGYATMYHAQPDCGVHAIQLEICRSQYLCEDFYSLSEHGVARQVAVVVQLIEALSDMVSRDSLPTAAE